MSVQVANNNLSAAVVGTTGKILFGKALPPATLAQQMQPQAAQGGATLLVWNESGCGLTCLFPIRGKSFTIPAGGWRELLVPPGDVELDYTVSYVLPNAPVALLFADLYLPGETVDASSMLGNSPIGLAGSVPTAVTQVVNDVNPAVNVVLEATPTSGPLAGVSSAKINNDGSGFVGGAMITFDANGNITGCTSLNWGKEQGVFASLSAFVDANGAAAAISSQLAGAATYLQFLVWNGSAVVSPLGLGTKALAGSYEGTIINDTGAFAKVGGQLSAGSFGVPLIVAQALRILVSTTALTTILTYVVPVSGLYRLSFFANVGGSGAIGSPLAQVTYTGIDTATQPAQVFISTSYTTAPTYLDGTHNIAHTFDLVTTPIVIGAAGGTNMIVQYQYPAGTVSDHVSVIIERLA